MKHRSLFAAALALAGAVAAASCAENANLGRYVDDGRGDPPSFVPDASGDGASVGDAGDALLSCVGTECYYPWATCSTDEGPIFKCGTDLAHDVNNCGACGHRCLEYQPIHMTSRCSEGACELECLNPPQSFGGTEWRNCNGKVDDGCEVDVLVDTANCGSCGNTCAPGVACIDGLCGCPAGFLYCDHQCVDPRTDDYNCGSCGNVCEPPEGACSPVPNARWACEKGTCGHLTCNKGAADCDGDLKRPDCTGNGCEVDDIGHDPKNCGGCGIVCVGDEECVDEGKGPACAVPCKASGRTRCDDECRDLLNDPKACGGCNVMCPAPGAHQAAVCSKGLCGFECTVGWGDCNGNPADGCEVDLTVHAGNCGACGNACDLAAGQPCIEGRCLMTECDAGVTR